jgi:hypothetical protein
MRRYCVVILRKNTFKRCLSDVTSFQKTNLSRRLMENSWQFAHIELGDGMSINKVLNLSDLFLGGKVCWFGCDERGLRQSRLHRPEKA